MSFSRRNFLRGIGAGVLGASAVGGLTGMRRAPQEGASAALLRRDLGCPAVADFDRLPREWYVAAIGRLRERLAEKGVDAVLLRDRWNIIYYTGLFHSTTERPFGVLIPFDTEALFWYNPGLDRDLVDTWWATGSDYYFDFLHAEGGFPNRGQVQQGRTVDLWEWTLRGVRERGYGEGTLGIDGELPPSAMQTLRRVMPDARVVDIAPDCKAMRMVKTPEEIALCQRAMDYFSRIHAFARDYLLERGTDATDYEIAHATERFGYELVMNDIANDGRPHNAVGVRVGIGCRAGVATAYPHPNQSYYKRIERGDALQIAGYVSIGGYGGECYRYYQILPWDARRERAWQVVSDCVEIQARESRHGLTCSSVAYKIHQHQVRNGVAELIYHRPAHGQGMEGHQQPWLALGDYTMLEEGMTFSVEPGLYDPEHGYGYNPSDLLLVARERGILMSSVPYTREWMILDL